MKKLLILTLLACLLLVGCSKQPTVGDSGTKPYGTFLPPSSTGHDHNHDHDHDHGNTNATQPGSSQSPVTTVPPVTTLPVVPVEFTLYLPNENGDGFVTRKTSMNDLHHDGIMLTLIVGGAVNGGVVVNSCTKDGTQLYLDLNQAFLDQLVTMGSSGEKMLIGSIVNTFLSAYNCETVLLTVNGESFDSGHTIYDFPLSFFE